MPNQGPGNNSDQQQNKEVQGQLNNRCNNSWDQSEVVCYNCNGTVHLKQGCLYPQRGRTQTGEGMAQQAGTRPLF